MSASLTHFSPKITEIGPISIHAKEVVLDLETQSSKNEPEKTASSASKPTNSPKNSKDSNLIPSWLIGAIVHPIDLDLDRWVLNPGKDQISGFISLKGGEPRSDQRWNIKFVSRTELPNKADLRVNAEIFPKNFEPMAVVRIAESMAHDLNLGYALDAKYTESKLKNSPHASLRAS